MSGASHLFLESVLNSLPCGVGVFDQQGKPVAENTVFRQLREGGVSVDEWDFTDQARSTEPLVLRERVLPDGRHIEIRGATLEQGGSVFVYTDVTQTKRSQETELAKRFLDSVIENMPLPVFVKDAADLRYVRVNRAVEELTGYARAEMLGRNEHELFPAAEANLVTQMDRQVLTETGSFVFEAPIQTRSKGIRILHTTKMAIRDESGRVRFLVGISEDVSDKTQHEQLALKLNAEIAQRIVEADAGNRAKSIFLATMSHEIRTPMSGMLGLLELLSLTRLDAEQRATLETIRESSRSLLRIVDDVLDYSKIEAGQLDIQEDVISIRRIVRDVERIFASTAASKGLTISRSVDPDISARVRVDPLRLRQILSNFVSNSIKFTVSGSIDIKVELIRRHQNVEHLRFLVRDTGIGISTENQRRLFQPFQQGDAAAARQAGGTGLGLTISRRLAGMMGGHVEMISQPGEGTTMGLTLELPIANTGDDPEGPTTSPPWQVNPVTGASHTPPETERAAAQRTLVLVVDDHPTNRSLLLRQMNTLGYAAETAEDGLQALEKWKTGRFALVVTDCEMPEMDGYELARCIRTIEARRTESRTPVIACTAHALADEADKCRAAGMDDCLFKPVDLAGLARMLALWLPRDAVPDPAEKSGGSGPAEVLMPRQELPFDLSVIMDTWGSDQATLREILDLFRRTNDEDADLLSEGIAGKDFAQVGRATHRMLGASKMIGAHAFSAACEAIERANRRGDWGELAAAMVEFEEQLASLRASIDSAGAAPS